MKTKFRLLFFIVCVVSIIFVAGCLTPGVIVEKAKTIDLNLGTTVGNHTYLPLNLKSYPENSVQDILQVLDTFEKAHPEFEVTSWNIEARSNWTYGLWVNHRQK